MLSSKQADWIGNIFIGVTVGFLIFASLGGFEGVIEAWIT